MSSLHRHQQHHQRERERERDRDRDLEVASSSSSSDDSDSDSDSDTDSSSVDLDEQHATPSEAVARLAKKKNDDEDESSSNERSSSDDDDDSADNDDESKDDVKQPKKRSIGASTKNCIDVPLSEQIRRRQEVDGWGRGGIRQGKDDRNSRIERKSRAIESAQQLLAKMKNEQKKKTTKKAAAENVDEESDDDDDDDQGFFAQEKKNKKKKKYKVERDDESDVSDQPNNEDDDDERSDGENQKKKPARNKKKKNKHKPTEASSKRADFFRRGAPKLSQSGVGVDIGANSYKPLDPRMSNLTGHYNEEQFQRNYEFLEQMRNQEIGQLRKRITARRTTGDKGKRLRRKLGLTSTDGGSSLEEDEAKLKALTQQRADLDRSKINREARQSVKRKLKDDVESGQHGAFFLKRREKKRLELEAKLEVIRKRKGDKAVNKVIEKRRKKQKAKDSSLFAK